MRFHQLFTIENIDIYQRSAHIDVRANQLLHAFHSALFARHLRIKFQLQRRGVSIAWLRMRDSRRERGHRAILAETGVRVCAVRNRFARLAAVRRCADARAIFNRPGPRKETGNEPPPFRHGLLVYHAREIARNPLRPSIGNRAALTITRS